MRPEYESEEDRKNEARVAEEVAEWAKAKVIKTPRFYPLDYAIERNGKVVALAEIKCRGCTITEYPTYMISLHKVATGAAIARAAGIPAYLFVKWQPSALAYLPMDAPPEYIGWGGRKDREDPQDMEPVVHFSLKTGWTQIL